MKTSAERYLHVAERWLQYGGTFEFVGMNVGVTAPQL
jgi:hypothetical protein